MHSLNNSEIYMLNSIWDLFNFISLNRQIHCSKLFHFRSRECQCVVDKLYYYMALSHKDWELANSRLWLAETDIDRGLDFPI